MTSQGHWRSTCAVFVVSLYRFFGFLVFFGDWVNSPRDSLVRFVMKSACIVRFVWSPSQGRVSRIPTLCEYWYLQYSEGTLKCVGMLVTGTSALWKEFNTFRRDSIQHVWVRCSIGILGSLPNVSNSLQSVLGSLNNKRIASESLHETLFDALYSQRLYNTEFP